MADEKPTNWYQSIKTKIISYMLLVSLVPIIGIAVLVYINMSGTSDTVSASVNESHEQLKEGLDKGRESMEQTSNLNMLSMSELMLSNLSNYLTERLQDMNNWANDERVIDALKNGGSREASDFIERNVARSTGIDSASICDLEGNTIIKTSSLISPIQHYKEWWQTAINGKLYVGNSVHSPELNGFTVQVGIPVTDPESNDLIGAFEATLLIDPRQVADAWGNRIPGSSVLLLSRNYGLIADSSDHARPLQGYPDWSEAELAAIAEMKEGNKDSGYVIKGDEVVVFSRWIADEKATEYFNVPEAPDPGWLIMMRMPASVAFAPFETIDEENVLASIEKLEKDVDNDTTGVLIYLMLILAMVTLAVFLLALWFSRGLTRPIMRLHHGVVEVIGGNLNHRVGSEASDEVGQLSRAFDKMTDTVNRTQAELKNYSKTLEKMVESRTKYLEDEVAERERAEEKLRTAHAQLQEAHDELKSSQEQLLQSSKLAAVGQLVSGVAHEVNNPLMAILGNSEMLLKKNEDERNQKRLQRIHDETNRAITIVRNLLSFARKQETEKVPVSVNESIENVINLRAYEMSLDNIKIETDIASDLPEVMADSQQLQQVFLNLLINAEQAIKEIRDNGKVIIRAERAGKKKIRITFADDGPGIPEGIQGRIFEPFFTTKDVGKGTGLGLSICYGIIEDHGGRITVESTEGQGATFIIELPVA